LEGYSSAVFSNVELLLNYLEQYQKTIPAKVNFFRHIVVEKTYSSQWFADHPHTSPGRSGRKQRDEIRRKMMEKYEAQESKKKAGRFRF